MADVSFTLNTGQKMPAVGYGTWQAAPGEVAAGVYHALKTGYRLIDCAYCYGNEAEVGEGLKRAFDEGVVKREDAFVVTKVWTTYNTRVALGLAKSLAALQLDYVDLLLVHWPLLMNPAGNDDRFPKLADGVTRDIIRSGYSHASDTWRQMEALLSNPTDITESAKSTKGTRAIGVSNYSKRYLEDLFALGDGVVIPAVNQIENHPALPQNEIVAVCKEKGIHVMAYSPLGSTGGPLFKEDKIVKVAEKHGVEPAAVLLSWHIPRGTTVLAKSVTPARIEANLKLVTLDDEDVQALNAYGEELERTGTVQRFVYPPFGIDFGFPDKS
ncbi:NADP-dependent oxidoreductase domain-containing protein [Coniella lustricola]|uniref:NADP-dependent oxidoreductase domain-containing protein n=1 Tax=Coniella lustricola TaxID=2025994 RepID=A0A2T2ZWG4_9PEZI|nr:NADP-dependent oxidoreductase domain-containing protein [Coniella lustricola]